jgi:hypothetical protein
VKGYAGGDNWCKKSVSFKENRKVAEAALEFLKLLGSNEKIESRPKIYLTENEVKRSTAKMEWLRFKEEKNYHSTRRGIP